MKKPGYVIVFNKAPHQQPAKKFKVYFDGEEDIKRHVEDVIKTLKFDPFLWMQVQKVAFLSEEAMEKNAQRYDYVVWNKPPEEEEEKKA